MSFNLIIQFIDKLKQNYIFIDLSEILNNPMNLFPESISATIASITTITSITSVAISWLIVLDWVSCLDEEWRLNGILLAVGQSHESEQTKNNLNKGINFVCNQIEWHLKLTKNFIFMEIFVLKVLQTFQNWMNCRLSVFSSLLY